MIELRKGIQSIIEACEAVKPGESILVIAEDDSESVLKGQAFMNVINSMDAEAVLTVITAHDTTGHEPPALVATAMKSVDAIFCIAEKAGVSHTSARKEALAAGARFYGLYQAPVKDLSSGLSVTDIQIIKERTEKLTQRLSRADTARVTTRMGTDVTLGLAGREGVAVHPLCAIEESSNVTVLPDYAEAAIAPVEGTAEGTIVIDLAMRIWGYLLKEPLRYTVKEGKVIDISGSKDDADALRKIAATDENASNIAELGIGTSHIIPGSMQGAARDFARVGTAHIGIGRNNDVGGKTWSQIHLDGLLNKPTIELDNDFILRDGAILI
ncbi:aminopeptidase [Thermodesulfobacteriota bacterium]